MKSFDWLTVVLVGLGVLMVVASRFARRSGVIARPDPFGRPSRPSPLKGGVALLGAALLLQFFRGFDVPVREVEFHSDGASVVVTGTLDNPHSFKLNAIVVDVVAVGAAGEIIRAEKVVVKEIVAGASSRFTATINAQAPVARVRVTAEGFWT